MRRRRKSRIAAHGVGIIEMSQAPRQMEVVRPSFFARRITAYTPIRVAGPEPGTIY